MVSLLGSTFADHLMPYFSKEFNRDDVGAWRTTCSRPSMGRAWCATQTFWTPERLLDSDVFDKVKDLGLGATFVDQSQHLRRWLRLAASQGEDAYRVNTVNGVDCFVINDRSAPTRPWYVRQRAILALHDPEARTPLRRLERTASAGADLLLQLGKLRHEEQGGRLRPDHRLDGQPGWIQIVTPDQVTRQQVDIRCSRRQW